MTDSHLLRAGDACAVFSSSGAQCRGWRIGTRNMLWPGDDAIWPAVAPVLFPTCGWSRNGVIRIGGQSFPMPVHGFVAQSLFEANLSGENALCFTLKDSDETRRHFPFSFALSITYTLEPLALAVTFRIGNGDQQIMPYAVGLHPGFALDWTKGPHRFVFDAAERAEVPVIAPGGLFSSRHRPVPLQGRVLNLAPELFAAEALCFLDVASRAFAWESPDGRLRIEAPDFPHLVLWNRAAAPFLAIESWTGTGDPEGFEGAFDARPSMIHLAPGQTRTHHVRYSWEPLGRVKTSA